VRVVEETLEDLGLGGKPRVVALNKVDRLPSAPEGVRAAIGLAPGERAVFISAAYGWGMEELLTALAETIREVREKGWAERAPAVYFVG
jgi:50S ribosomal subunit-associated GTPase HflX